LENIGVPRADAIEFALGGCSETHIAGKGAIRDAYLNIAKVLEATLYNGRVSPCGPKLGPETGAPESFEDFAAFLSAYKTQAEWVIDTFVRYRNQAQKAVARVQPALVRSVFIASCIDRGLSQSEGGADYTYGLADVYGVPNVANSLFVIKTLVFERSLVSMGQLISALHRDFEDEEDLRRLCLTQHKYGNDHDDVDSLAREVSDHLFGYLQRHKIWRGGIYYGCCASAPGWHVLFGKATGATPDGRHARQLTRWDLCRAQTATGRQPCSTR